jgi:hypothetical protein
MCTAHHEQGKACIGEKGSAQRDFLGAGRGGEGKRPLGSAGGRCEDNIEVGLKEIKWEGVDSIHLAEDWDTWRAVVNAVMNL